MPPRKHPRNSHLLQHIHLYDEIEVWWPHDQTYYPGRITKELAAERHRVVYTDGEIEELRLETEQWRFRGTAAARVQSLINTRSQPTDASSPDPNWQDPPESPPRSVAPTSSTRRQSKKPKSRSGRSASSGPAAAVASSTSSSRRRSSSQPPHDHSSKSAQKPKSAVSSPNKTSASDSLDRPHTYRSRPPSSSAFQSSSAIHASSRYPSDQRAMPTNQPQPASSVDAKPESPAAQTSSRDPASLPATVSKNSLPNSPPVPRSSEHRTDTQHELAARNRLSAVSDKNEANNHPFKRKVSPPHKLTSLKRMSADSQPASSSHARKTPRLSDPSDLKPSTKTSSLPSASNPVAAGQPNQSADKLLRSKNVKDSAQDVIPSDSPVQEAPLQPSKVDTSMGSGPVTAAAGTPVEQPVPPPIPDKSLLSAEGNAVRASGTEKPKSPVSAMRESAASIHKRADLAHQKALAAASIVVSKNATELRLAQAQIPVNGAPTAPASFESPHRPVSVLPFPTIIPFTNP